MIKNTSKILIIAAIILVCFTASAALAGSSFIFTFNTPNSQLMITSGGVVIFGLTIGIVSGYYRAKNETNDNTMYASLLTFDTESEKFRLKIPDASLKNDTLYMPIFQWKF